MTDNEIMSLEKAMFILRHGSAEGEHKYFEAIDVIEKEYNRLKAEIERWRTECGNQSTLWSKHYESIFETAKETIKAEAIKEFEERLKERKYQSSDWSHGEHTFVVEDDDIDDLVKEMVGESE